MKKNTRYILITLIVAVVLGGAIAALLLTQPEAEEETSSSSSTSSSTDISVFSYEDADIESITVKNPDGELKILTRTETVEASSSEDEDSSSEPEEKTVFYLDGIDEDLQSTSSVSTLAGYGTSLSATSEIGNKEDLSLAEYGLDSPEVTVTTVLKDGTETSYSIGDQSPISGYYILYGDKVYVALASDTLYKTPLDFVNMTVLSITPPESDDSSTEATNEYTAFNFSGTNFPQEVKIVPDTESLTATFRLTEPYEVSANTTTLNNIVTSIESLTATSVAAVDPTEEQLEEYGLKDPAVRMSFTVNGESYTLLSGKVEDSKQYVMLDGVDVVYVFGQDTVSSWADATLFTVRDSFVWLQMITEVNKLTVETPDKTDVFTLTRTENEESSTEDNTVYDYTVKGTDGQDITYQGVFTTYYQTIIGVQLLDETTETTVSGDPMLRVTYEFYEGGSPKVVEFYSIGNRRCLVKVDDEVVGVVSESLIQDIIDNTEIVLQNKSVDPDDEESE